MTNTEARKITYDKCKVKCVVCEDDCENMLVGECRKRLEALEHITCADCEHYYFADNRIPEQQCYVCDYWGADNPGPTGYCNHAVRKVRG